MGRFLSPDWASDPTAVPYASYANPQSLNLYNYMRNNPLGGTDPDGHCCFLQDLVQGWRQIGSNIYDALEAGAESLFTQQGANRMAINMMAGAVVPPPAMEESVIAEAPATTINVTAAAAPELETESVATTSLIQQNAAQGAAWEDAVGASLKQTDPNTASQVTLETQSGVQTRMDFVSRDTNGNVALTEAKSSATAPLTRNQAAKQQHIQRLQTPVRLLLGRVSRGILEAHRFRQRRLM